MDKTWWFLIGAITVIALFGFLKIKYELDKLKETIRSNKASIEKDVLLSRKEISLLESELKLTNKNVDSQNSKLDDIELTIKRIKLQIEDNEKQLVKKYQELSNLIGENEKKFDSEISQLAKSILDIKGINEELKNQLAIFTEIDADSTQLNAEAPYKVDEKYILEKNAEKESKSKLDAEQQKIFDLMNNSKNNLFVTGKAGTGKSFLLKYFVEETDKKTLVLAPTGIAALNAKGVTIHSAFGYVNLGLEIDNITNANLRLKSEKRQVLKNVETIIIDEISMVRADILEKIDRILKILNNNNLPFGGKQLLLFGDLYQLPPIADKEELKYLKDTFGGKHFFHSNAYKFADFIFFELTINHRQKDDATFFKVLNNIREGKVSEEDLTLLNTRTQFKNEELRRVVQLFPRKGEVDNINQRELDKIPAKEYIYKCRVVYKKSDLTFDIEKTLPISETLKLKLGALVMMVTNDVNHRWVNGTLAIVSYISEKCIKVKIDGYEHEIFPTSFKQRETFYENGKIIYKDILGVEQYPVVLAYAITIHKSQGMTYKRIACNVSDCFETGQIYVALSRCTSMDGLYLLNTVDRKMLGVDTEILEFYKKEREKIKSIN